MEPLKQDIQGLSQWLMKDSVYFELSDEIFIRGQLNHGRNARVAFPSYPGGLQFIGEVPDGWRNRTTRLMAQVMQDEHLWPQSVELELRMLANTVELELFGVIVTATRTRTFSTNEELRSHFVLGARYKNESAT